MDHIAYAAAEPGCDSVFRVIEEPGQPEWNLLLEVFHYEFEGETFEAVMGWNEINGVECIYGALEEI